jgi:hypothetical protein
MIVRHGLKMLWTTIITDLFGSDESLLKKKFIDSLPINYLLNPKP